MNDSNAEENHTHVYCCGDADYLDRPEKIEYSYGLLSQISLDGRSQFRAEQSELELERKIYCLHLCKNSPTGEIPNTMAAGG